MAQIAEQLTGLLAPRRGSIEQDVMAELQSVLRLHSLSPEELSYKWESYMMKMGGGDETQLDIKTVRDFKKDINEALERESRRPLEKKQVGATPRAAKGDMFEMMDGVVSTPLAPINGNSAKRRQDFATPGSKAAKQHARSSPTDARVVANKGAALPFAERSNAGEIIESLNGHIDIPSRPALPFHEPRIKMTANTDLAKFTYKPMAMKLSTASEILDDRIDAFLETVQEHHNLDDSVFGNPAAQNPSEIVAVGRIASDTPEGKLNAASAVLETSRRTGAGLRVPLNLDSLKAYDLFPGKIAAFRGTNPNGESFIVQEMLEIPLLNPAVSSFEELEVAQNRMRCGDNDGSIHPLNILVGAGPYTSDDNLSFEPLQALCDKAASTAADALVLVGPLLDVEHPLVTIGDFPPLPASMNVSQDSATLSDVFRALVATHLEALAKAVPHIVIIIVPSVRDTISKHTAWPQDRPLRKGLGLPKQCTISTNPFTVALNEIRLAVSSQDTLFELKRESCSKQTTESKPLLDRLTKNLIEQRHFFPLYPSTSRENLPRPTLVEGSDGPEADNQAIGASLDVPYLALGEWQNARPDILITPSGLAPFTKVVDSVLTINPGTVSKRRSPGTFAQLYVKPREIGDDEKTEEKLAHKVYERARVDVMRV